MWCQSGAYTHSGNSTHSQALQDPTEAFICWRKIKELTIGSLHVF